MDELKDKGKRVIENIGEKRHDLIQKWENKSREYIDTFLLLFGREGRLVKVLNLTFKFSIQNCVLTFNVPQTSIWNEGKGRLRNALSPPSSPPRMSGESSSASSSPPPKIVRYEEAAAEYSSDESGDRSDTDDGAQGSDQLSAGV